MSNTLKDQPVWVRATEFEAQHVCHIFNRECDIPSEPIRDYDKASWRPVHGSCYWSPVWDRNKMPSPPRDFVKAVYHGPQRRIGRESCLALVNEYNTYGEIESDDPPGIQGRGSAEWLWW